ncbi:MAG TPA: hypothetical protein VFH47_05550 [Candidatus Thermoplasmatota archaeon]|nr:hypothetical protein [Candidatus Thermoplasmatota archaeon]
MRRPARRARPPAGEAAVSAVIGTLLVLAITVVSITAVLAWGRPALEQVQQESELRAVVPELQEVREVALGLRGTDASRSVAFRFGSGQLSLDPATPLLVTVVYGTCDLRVESWADGVGAAALSAPACSGTLTLHQNELRGAARIARAGPTTLDRDWVFELRDGTDLLAEAYLFAGHRLAWTGGASAWLEHGAIQSTGPRGDRLDAPLHAAGAAGAAPTDALLLRIPGLHAAATTAVPPGTRTVTLTATTSSALVDAPCTTAAAPEPLDCVREVRVEVPAHAGLWCDALLLTNTLRPADSPGAWQEASSPEATGHDPPCDEPRDDGGRRYVAARHARGGDDRRPFAFHLQRTVIEVALAL